MGFGLCERGRSRAVDGAVDLVVETIDELQRRRRLRSRTEPMHELSLTGAIVNTVVKHAAGRPVTRRQPAVGRAAPGRAGHARVLLRVRRAGHGLRGRAARAGADPGAAALRGVRARVGDRAAGRSVPGVRCAGGVEVAQRRRVRGRVDRGRGGRMHRTKVKIVEEALDANNTIAQANRADFDRAGVTRRQLHERARAPARRRCSSASWRTCPGVRVGVLEGDVQGSMDADRLARLHVPVTQLNTDPGFGGECHLDANMVRSALPALPLDEIDLLVIENVGNLVCPAEFRVGEDARVMVSLGHRGRGQAAQVPADVPRLRAGAGQQDRPAAAPRLRPRPVPLQPRRGPPGRRADARERADRRGHRRVARLARRRSAAPVEAPA